MLLAETSQQVVQVAGALQEKHEALVITQNKMVEMQSQMDAMMNQIKDQNNMIRALQVQKTDPTKHPIIDLKPPPKLGAPSSSSSMPKSFVLPMPCTSIPESFAVSPIVRSIATPRSSYPGTEIPVGPTGQSQCAVPRASGFYGEELRPAPSPEQCPGEMHMAPPMLPPEILRNWQVGSQIQGDQSIALSIQVQQLANQVQTITNEMNSHQSNRHGRRPSNRSDQRPRAPQSPPGSGSSSSSSSSHSKKGGRGMPGGSGPPSAVGDVVSSPGSSGERDPYKVEKKTMRVKYYDQVKLPPLPADAARCRNFRNSVFSIVCKYAKNDESQVFQWISLCNTSEKGDEFNSSGDFPILDRILGAKILEMAKSTKFALEFHLQML